MVILSVFPQHKQYSWQFRQRDKKTTTGLTLTAWCLFFNLLCVTKKVNFCVGAVVTVGRSIRTQTGITRHAR